MFTNKQIKYAADITYKDFQIENGQAVSVSELMGAEDCAGWSIVNTFDDNDPGGTGLYACMIDTGDGNCIIAFRGSEAGDAETFFKDWIVSDVGLVNNGETAQQQAAREYAEYIYQQYGDRYENITFAGHSLGGNLAEHAAITAPDGLKEKCNAVSLDGPGYSAEYISAHRDEIEKMSGKLERYQWSMVGRMLKPLPGEKYETVQSSLPEGSRAETIFGLTIGDMRGLAMKHSLEYCDVFDENGNFRKGYLDILALTCGEISRRKDFEVKMLSSIPGFGWAADYLFATGTRAVTSDRKHPTQSVSADILKTNPMPGIAGNYSFRINCSAAEKQMNSMREYSSKMMQAEEGIRAITSNLFGTGVQKNASALLISKALTAEIEHIEQTRTDLDKLRETGEECIRRYKETEDIIAGGI